MSEAPKYRTSRCVTKFTFRDLDLEPEAKFGPKASGGNRDEVGAALNDELPRASQPSGNIEPYPQAQIGSRLQSPPREDLRGSSRELQETMKIGTRALCTVKNRAPDNFGPIGF
jgi:hypothetical protein